MTLTTKITKEDLVCCVCFELIEFPLIQCTRANQFICLICVERMNKMKCPCCRSNILFYNTLIEQSLMNVMTDCVNDECEIKVFPWMVDKHLIKCPHSDYHCTKMTSLSNLVDHLKSEECVQKDYLEFHSNSREGSANLLMPTIESDSRDMKMEIKNCTVVIYDDLIIMFTLDSVSVVKRMATRDVIKVSFNEKIEDSHSSRQVVKINPSNNLNELVSIPVSILGLIRLQCVSPTRRDSVDRFFGRMIERDFIQE